MSWQWKCASISNSCRKMLYCCWFVELVSRLVVDLTFSYTLYHRQTRHYIAIYELHRRVPSSQNEMTKKGDEFTEKYREKMCGEMRKFRIAKIKSKYKRGGGRFTFNSSYYSLFFLKTNRN